MDTFVKAAGGEEFSVGRKSDRVNGFGVLGEGVDASAALHVPEANRGVEGGTGGRGEGSKRT